MERRGGSLIGTDVAGHRLVSVLGAGGMGEVYVAEHTALGTRRAFKVIHDDVAGSPSIVKRFMREATVLGSLRHPNVVDVIDYGHLSNGWPFLMLELIEGGDLQKLLTDRGAMPPQAALNVLLQVARVLEYAHGQGVVHRDLKPGNLLLEGGDPQRLKVIDFGLVKLISAELLTELTQAREIMGSPDYMAPEQASGFPDIREPADIYALGGIAYTVLSGQTVFGPRPALAAVYAQAREVPPRLSERMRIPPKLDELLCAALAKEPTARPTATQFATVVGDLLGELGAIRFKPTEPGAPRESPPVPDAAALFETQLAPENELATPVVTGPLPNSLAGAFAGGSGTAPGDVVQLSPSMVKDVGAARAADLIFSSVRNRSPSRLREALSRQMLAVVNELSALLAPHHENVANRRHSIEAIEEQLQTLELDLALVEADLVAGGGDDRSTLQEKRASIAGQTNRLRKLLEAEQREVAILIERARDSAPSSASALYSELGAMIDRVRELDDKESK